MIQKNDINQVIKNACNAMNEIKNAQELFTIWDHLKEKDSDGNQISVLPYTEKAIQGFTKIFNSNPNDINIVHHLAIAHHARAWDYELSNHPDAITEWEKAIDYWEILVSSDIFWDQMKNKYHRLDPQSDLKHIDNIRHSLFEQLMEIHLEFIQHYCEKFDFYHAKDHANIVNTRTKSSETLNILSKNFLDKMTESHPEAIEEQDYESALSMIECFLLVFPNYLPALSLYAETANKYLDTLSYKTNWNDIIALEKRIEKSIFLIDENNELEKNPLVKQSLSDLCRDFAQKSYHQGDSYFEAYQNDTISALDLNKGIISLELAIKWGRLGYKHATSASDIDVILSNSLLVHSMYIRDEVCNIMDSDEDISTRIDTCIDLLTKAQSNLKEAEKTIDGNSSICSLLTKVNDDLEKIISAKNQMVLDW